MARVMCRRKDFSTEARKLKRTKRDDGWHAGIPQSCETTTLGAAKRLERGDNQRAAPLSRAVTSVARPRHWRGIRAFNSPMRPCSGSMELTALASLHGPAPLAQRAHRRRLRGISRRHRECRVQVNYFPSALSRMQASTFFLSAAASARA